MTANLVTPPLEEPVSLLEMKAYLKLDTDYEDALLRAFITAARVHLENLTGRHLLSQTWRLLLIAPLTGHIVLPVQPVRAVSSAAILSEEGDVIALDASPFPVFQAQDPAILNNINDYVLQSGQRLQLDVETGFGPTPEDVPQPLRQALYLIVAEWFEKRLVVDPIRLPGLNQAIAPLIGPYRTIRL